MHPHTRTCLQGHDITHHNIFSLTSQQFPIALYQKKKGDGTVSAP
jgi:hypothetical protein